MGITEIQYRGHVNAVAPASIDGAEPAHAHWDLVEGVGIDYFTAGDGEQLAVDGTVISRTCWQRAGTVLQIDGSARCAATYALPPARPETVRAQDRRATAQLTAPYPFADKGATATEQVARFLEERPDVDALIATWDLYLGVSSTEILAHAWTESHFHLKAHNPEYGAVCLAYGYDGDANGAVDPTERAACRTDPRTRHSGSRGLGQAFCQADEWRRCARDGGRIWRAVTGDPRFQRLWRYVYPNQPVPSPAARATSAESLAFAQVGFIAMMLKRISERLPVSQDTAEGRRAVYNAGPRGARWARHCYPGDRSDFCRGLERYLDRCGAVEAAYDLEVYDLTNGEAVKP